MPPKVKVTAYNRTSPSGTRTHVRAQNRNPPKVKPVKSKKR